MRLFYLLQKEFIQIRRNAFLSRMIVFMPIVQMLLLVPAVTFELKKIHVCVVDDDQTALSRRLMTHLEGASLYHLRVAPTTDQAMKAMDQGLVDVVLVIPYGFEQRVMRLESPSLQLLVNGINGSLAQTALSYLNHSLQDFARGLRWELGPTLRGSSPFRIAVSSRFLYNTRLLYSIYMAPGILAVLITAIGFMFSGLNLVREKEIGTAEQLNVTPLKGYEFILGKMIPFLLLGLFDLAFGLALARLFYGMPIAGNLLSLFSFAILYLVGVMGLGLFLSTFCWTQSQYLFTAYFFMMIFLLMSGIFTPIESMPDWAIQVNRLNPTAYFIRVLRMVLLKGSGWGDIRDAFAWMGGIALMTTGLASFSYRKRL